MLYLCKDLDEEYQTEMWRSWRRNQSNRDHVVLCVWHLVCRVNHLRIFNLFISHDISRDARHISKTSVHFLFVNISAIIIFDMDKFSNWFAMLHMQFNFHEKLYWLLVAFRLFVDGPARQLSIQYCFNFFISRYSALEDAGKNTGASKCLKYLWKKNWSLRQSR